MIVALLLAQVTALAGPRESVAPATGWKCRYVRSDGAKFELSGVFPEFPAGSASNTPLPTLIAGNGPAVLVGEKSVDSFRPRGGKRNYQVGVVDLTGDRYNLNFLLAERDETHVDITHWRAKEERLVTYAKGKCTADFNPSKQSAP